MWWVNLDLNECILHSSSIDIMNTSDLKVAERMNEIKIKFRLKNKLDDYHNIKDGWVL